MFHTPSLRSGQAKSFPLRRQKGERGTTIDGSERPVIDELKIGDAAVHSYGTNELPLLRSEITTHTDQMQIGNAVTELAANLQENVDTLSRDRTADVKHHDRADRRTNETIGFTIALGIGTAEVIRTNAYSCDHGAIGWNDAARHQFVPNRGGVTSHPSRTLQPGEHMASHRLEQPRAGLVGRPEHRAKRVEIVTGHHGSSRRQTVHKLRIAVVDHVKYIVFAIDCATRCG